MIGTLRNKTYDHFLLILLFLLIFLFSLTMVNALGHVSTATYDAGTGNKLTETKNDITTTFVYDVFGRVSKEIMPLDTVWQPTKSYNYSFDGIAPEQVVVKLKTTANNTDTIRYYYDGFGQLIQLKKDIENNQQVVQNFVYDSQGRVISVQNPYFTNHSHALTAVSSNTATNYSYDALDRVISVRNADGTFKNITFDRRNITDVNENEVKHVYQLDGYDRIVRVFEFNNDTITGANETYTTAYSYDGNDNLVQIIDTEGNVFSFTYDSLSRKIAMDDSDLGHWVYRYDGNGNLVLQAGSNGALITGDGYFREYNDFGQMIRIRNGSVVTAPLLEEYFYDPDGQRVKIKRNDTVNTTVYTPYKEMERIVNTSGTYDFYYVYHEGQLVARKNPDGATVYFHGDHLGSTSVVTNSTAQVVESTRYSPFGEELSGGAVDARGYTGQFDDALTEQMYYGARYYMPVFGIWTSADPVIQNVYDPQLLNHYAYVRNNPYKLIDPDGKEVIVAVTHSDIPILGDTGHIAFAVRVPETNEFVYFSDSGPPPSSAPGLVSNLEFNLKAIFGYSKSEYEVAVGSSADDVIPDRYYDSFVIQTSPVQDRMILDRADSIVSNPQSYYLRTRNSQDFVIEALAAGDINFERKMYPKETFENNKDNFVYYTYTIEGTTETSTTNSRGGSNGQAEALNRYWDRIKKDRGES